MKKLSCFSVIIIFSWLFAPLFSQDNIKWDVFYNQEKNEIFIEATLDNGWYLYSQHIDENIGPIPTEISFEENEEIELIEDVKEPEGEEVYDKNFGSDIVIFKDFVRFNQEVRPLSEGRHSLSGSILFMMCNKEGCSPPIVHDFSIVIE